MIGQHYYTRERKGLFRPSEGYDSIAKSRSLGDAFIKKYLHPVCFYDPPRSLETSGEKDPSKYPESYMCFHAENGEMVLGRSVYVGADFTGLRSTFFTHNFIIPGDEKEEYIRNIDEAVFAKGYVGCYDIGKGMEIPDIPSLDYDAELAGGFNVEALERLGVTEDVFKKIIYAVIMSSSGRKKVYVTLDVDISELARYSRVLLKYILNALPYDVRRNTGYITYLKEPESRKFINIMFVENGSLIASMPKINREYIFDLARGKVSNVEVITESHPYLNYVWNNICSDKKTGSFHEFANDLLFDMKQDVKLSLEAYDELCTLYRIKDGDTELYISGREAIYDSILKYLSKDNINKKNKLREITLELINLELDDISNTPDYLPNPEIIKRFTECFKLGDTAINREIARLLLLALGKSRKVQGDYISIVFSTLGQNREMYSWFIDGILESPSSSDIFESYIEMRFSKVSGFESLSSEIRHWEGVSQKAIADDAFQEAVYKKTMRTLKESGDMVTAAKRIRELFEAFGRNNGCHELAAYILRETEEYVYRNISLDEISMKDVLGLELRVKRDESKFKILEYIHGLVIDGRSINPYDIFRMDNGMQVRDIIRRIYINNIEYKNYPRIILGFIKEPRLFTYDYSGLLKYISSKGKNEVHQFLIWSFEEGVFSGSGNFDEYRKSIRDYFINCDREALKDKKIKAFLLDTDSKALQKLLKEIELDIANPVVRFVKLHRRQFAALILAIFLLSAIALGIFKVVDMLTAGARAEESFKAAESLKPPVDPKTKHLDESIRESVDALNGDMLLNYLYKIECDVVNSEGLKDTVSTMLTNMKEEDKFTDSAVLVENETPYKGYTLSYSIVMDKKQSTTAEGKDKDDGSIEDKDKEEFKDSLVGAVIGGMKHYIDNPLDPRIGYLGERIKKAVASLRNGGKLSDCSAIIKCEVQDSSNADDVVSTLLINMDGENINPGSGSEIKGEETYKSYKLSYSILLDKKPDVSLKDRELEKLQDALEKAIVNELKYYIDNPSDKQQTGSGKQ